MSNFHIENILSAPIYENYGNWFSFFSCKNSHCTNEYSIYPCTHNCVIKYFHTTKNQSCNKKFTRDDIVNEIINSKNNYFKDEADIIYDMNINWDIVPNKNRIFSYKNYFKTRNKCYELYDKYPEIINKPKCQYRLWGGDESEFYKPDFICSTTTVPFLNQERLIRRMTPLLSYGHNQIYFDAWSFIKTEFSNDNIYAFNHIIK
jgi:predicted transcriptional regulator